MGSFVQRDENGYFHREDGPAVVTHDGSEYWYKHGERHRKDGPAIWHPSGKTSYWVNGRKLDSESPLIKYIKEKERRKNGKTDG